LAFIDHLDQLDGRVSLTVVEGGETPTWSGSELGKRPRTADEVLSCHRLLADARAAEVRETGAEQGRAISASSARFWPVLTPMTIHNSPDNLQHSARRRPAFVAGDHSAFAVGTPKMADGPKRVQASRAKS
jgi:hypothetical protein